eukprot:2463228-Amphidinium_carterae.1
MGSAEEDKDIIDFILVDYSAMFQHMTMDEALAGSVTAATGAPEHLTVPKEKSGTQPSQTKKSTKLKLFQ